jgi:solute carrier family 13 (sodium-dependent dicarboxylate transporter), member 2/3/5
VSAPVFATRHVAGIAAGIIALAAMLLLPPPAPITEVGMARLGLLAFAIIWWVATPLPLAFTTLAVLGVGVALGAMSVNAAFAHSSSWVLWFVIGSFGLAAALEATGVNRRFALAFLDMPFARGRSHAFLMMFLGSATLMSAFMANTVVAVIWLSLALKIYQMLGVDTSDPLVEANTLGIAWAANIGGIATPVGNGTNAPAIALIAAATGVTVSFLQWTIIGTVLTLLFLVTALLVFRLTVPIGSDTFARPETTAFIAEERRRLGPMPPVERWAIGWFLCAILLWFVPDLARFVASKETADLLQRNLHMTVPAILIPVVMCLVPVRDPNRRFVLTWHEWMQGIDWGLVIFIGGVMGLGTAVGEEVTGLPQYVRAALQPSLGHLSEYTFVLVMCAGVILVTSVVSNMVTLAIFVPLGLTLSQSLGIADPVALGVVLGIGPSLDYLLPSGTTTNAIVAGSGYLRVSTMVRHGIILFVVHTLLLAFVGYPLARLVLGR